MSGNQNFFRNLATVEVSTNEKQIVDVAEIEGSGVLVRNTSVLFYGSSVTLEFIPGVEIEETEVEGETILSLVKTTAPIE